MFSFKTIKKNKSNYKGCYLCSTKGFSTLVKTSLANLIVSVIPASSKPQFQIAQFKGYFYITRRDPV